MSRRLAASDYDNVIALINAVAAVPANTGAAPLRCTGTTACGYTAALILESFRVSNPASTLTDAQVLDLLVRASRSGVFKVACAGATAADPAFCSASDPSADLEPLYRINLQMARYNPLNQVYADYYNGPPTPQPVGVYDPFINPTEPILSWNVANISSN